MSCVGVELIGVGQLTAELELEPEDEGAWLVLESGLPALPEGDVVVVVAGAVDVIGDPNGRKGRADCAKGPNGC